MKSQHDHRGLGSRTGNEVQNLNSNRKEALERISKNWISKNWIFKELEFIVGHPDIHCWTSRYSLLDIPIFIDGLFEGDYSKEWHLVPELWYLNLVPELWYLNYGT